MIPVRIMCTREQIVEICKETARFYDQFAVFATLVATETVDSGQSKFPTGGRLTGNQLAATDH
ncbi:hypothetical protein ACFRQM_24520 [Streptomyces sp. NPDC056831]|uniref:hypothetical protein n=1 Tax=Streptomyces sp. NPDC056831 TaxID=3345954 RepID=UPI0036C19622